jgi:hypothetical protein
MKLAVPPNSVTLPNATFAVKAVPLIIAGPETPTFAAVTLALK